MSIHTLVLDGVSPTSERGIVQALYQAACADHKLAPTLVISRLTGDGVAVGRFQFHDPLSPYKRLTGGPVCAYGEGQVSLQLVMPDWARMGHGAGLDKLINRTVRGTLRSLNELGIRSLYGGREFIVSMGRPSGLVSMVGDGAGTGLFQCVLGWTQPVQPVAGAAPPQRPWGTLATCLPGLSFARLVSALIDGHAHTSKRTPQPVAAPTPETLPADMDSPPDGLCWSPPVAIPVGQLRAGVRLDDDGRLAQVRFSGDWIGDTGGINQLCEALCGVLPAEGEVADVVGRVYPPDGLQHTLLGLRAVVDITAAILAAVAASETSR